MRNLREFFITTAFYRIMQFTIFMSKYRSKESPDTKKEIITNCFINLSWNSEFLCNTETVNP